MNNLVLSSYYLPCVSYIQQCVNSSAISIEVNDNYVKGSYRNRVHIASAAGILRLSIPLEKGKHQQQPIKAVRISYDQNWQRIHWQAICSCYNHSPYFEFYKDGLEVLYQKPVNFLADWNMELLQWLLNALKLKIPIQFTADYKETPAEGVVDARNLFSPKEVPTHVITYPQVFLSENGFLPDLSGIDMLFNIGGADMAIKLKQR